MWYNSISSFPGTFLYSIVQINQSFTGIHFTDKMTACNYYYTIITHKDISNYFTLNVLDEVYSRNALCTLN